MHFDLFVYGTLKRGYRYHDAYCRGYRAVEPATTIGRVYLLPPGYPMLEIPRQSILAAGTSDPLADARTQTELAEKPDWTIPADMPQGWPEISGEVLTFDDPATRLPHIDALEDFHPESASQYQRVVILVRLRRDPRPTLRPVWTYIAPDGELPPGAKPLGNSWP